MGGNALKSIQTRRVSAEEYPLLCDDILTQLKAKFPTALFAIPDAVRDKVSYGDIDIVACDLCPESEPLGAGNTWHLDVIDLFKPSESFLNSNVFSFEYKMVQVDIICVPFSSFDFTTKYLSYNDLGGLMHVITKHYGFYLGQSGLRYKVYADTEKSDLLANILVTSDFYKALKLFGFDPVRYAQGFDSLDDMFAYVKANPYYDPALYLFENRNNQDKFRDQKRKTYMSFLRTVEAELVEGNRQIQVKNVPNFFFNATVQFPSFLEEYADAARRVRRATLFANTWNYTKISQAFGLNGKSFKVLWQSLVAYRYGSWAAFREYVVSEYYDEARLFQQIQQLLDEGLDPEKVHAVLKEKDIPYTDRSSLLGSE